VVRKKQVVTVEIQVLDTQITSCDHIVPGLLGTKGEDFTKHHQKLILIYDLSYNRNRREHRYGRAPGIMQHTGWIRLTSNASLKRPRGK